MLNLKALKSPLKEINVWTFLLTCQLHVSSLFSFLAKDFLTGIWHQDYVHYAGVLVQLGNNIADSLTGSETSKLEMMHGSVNQATMQDAGNVKSVLTINLKHYILMEARGQCLMLFILVSHLFCSMVQLSIHL